MSNGDNIHFNILWGKKVSVYYGNTMAENNIFQN